MTSSRIKEYPLKSRLQRPRIGSGGVAGKSPTTFMCDWRRKSGRKEKWEYFLPHCFRAGIPVEEFRARRTDRGNRGGKVGAGRGCGEAPAVEDSVAAPQQTQRLTSGVGCDSKTFARDRNSEPQAQRYSLWTLLGSNQRPYACEASARIRYDTAKTISRLERRSELPYSNPTVRSTLPTTTPCICPNLVLICTQ